MTAVARKKRSPGKLVPKRTRALWAINPRTRVHSNEGYRRARAKAAERRRIAEDMDRGDF